MTALTPADLTDAEANAIRTAVDCGGWLTASSAEAIRGPEIAHLTEAGVFAHEPLAKVRRYVLTDAGKALAEELGP